MYYLRARYYNPSNGLFNQVDPFAGSPQDPQSLHKYLYAHDNPINGIDPSGTEYLISFIMAMTIFAIILAFPSEGTPKNVCGPDVTAQIKSLDTKTVSWFKSDIRDDARRRNYCSGRMNISHGWDIHEFKRDYYEGEQFPISRLPSGCATGRCKDTVMVNGKCTSTHEVNYYFFGVTTRLCVLVQGFYYVKIGKIKADLKRIDGITKRYIVLIA